MSSRSEGNTGDYFRALLRPFCSVRRNESGLCSLLCSSSFQDHREVIVHLCKPVDNFNQALSGKVVDKFCFSGHPSGKLAPNFHEAEAREVWDMAATFSEAWSVCEGSTDVHRLCLWILKETQFSELLHLSWRWPWDGSQSAESHFCYAWVPGGRLWPCGHCWRNQDDRLNSVAHSSPSHLFGVLWGVCIYPMYIYCICVHLEKKPGFRCLVHEFRYSNCEWSV